MNKFDDVHNMHYDATSIVTSFSAMLLIAVSFRCYLATNVRHLLEIKKKWLHMSQFLITQIVGLRLVNRIY